MIGMSAAINSQMTQDEVIAYAASVVALVSTAGKIDPQLRAQIVMHVVAVCGRPIAKAEQEQIATAQAEFERQGSARVARPVPFPLPRDAQQNHGPDSGQVPAPAPGEW